MTKPGRGSKNKGANAEREVAAIMQPIMDKVYAEFDKKAPKMERNLEQTRGGGYDLVGIPWLALEVKRQETLSIKAWWEQTLKQSGPLQMPVLIYRQNRKKWRVMLVGGLKIRTGRWLKSHVDISIEDFLKYFEHLLRQELGKEEQTSLLEAGVLQGE